MESILSRLPGYEGPAFGSYIVLAEHMHSISDVVWRAVDDVIRESGSEDWKHPFSTEEYSVLGKRSAHQLIWVARTREAADQFGSPEKIQEIPIPSNARIMVDNGKGGFLVWIGQPALTPKRLFWALCYTYRTNLRNIVRDLGWEISNVWYAITTFVREVAGALGRALLGLLKICLWPFLSPISVAINIAQLDLRKVDAARRGEVKI